MCDIDSKTGVYSQQFSALGYELQRPIYRANRQLFGSWVLSSPWTLR